MRYLLVEHPGPWPIDGLAGIDLPADIHDQLTVRCAALPAAIVLIRRPRRHESPVCLMRSWCAIDTDAPAGHRVRWGAWSYPDDLLGGVERLEQTSAGGARLGGAGPDDPVLLVGPGTSAFRLTQRWPEAVWECSELDPAILVLPEGAAYDDPGLVDLG